VGGAVKKIVVVGVGALGSHLVQFLRSTDSEIVAVDFDRVEQKNVLSQFHGKTGVGKGKAASLQQTMNFLFGRKVGVVPHMLVPDNAREILGGADLVVDCLDNGVSRATVQNFVRKERIACLHGALAPDGGFGRAIWDESFSIDDEPSTGAATCEDGEHLPFIVLTAAYMARSVQAFLATGRKTGYSVTPAGAMVT
jgi:molybdopterin/thiamine biosynthesis adenylyltransferase